MNIRPKGVLSRIRQRVANMSPAEIAAKDDCLSPAPRTLLCWLREASLKPFFAAAAITFLGFLVIPSGDIRLLAVALTAAFFNFAVIMLSYRSWPGGIAVLGLLASIQLQAIGLIACCVYGALGYLEGYFTYTILNGFEGRVLLLLLILPLALLLVLVARRLFLTGQNSEAPGVESQRVAFDQRLPILLICCAVFSLLFWAGAELTSGMVKAVFQTLQRSFMFVSFLAGLHFRVSRAALITWLVVLTANLGLGIATGSRSPAFVPAFLFALGLLAGATARQRLAFVVSMAIAAFPAMYVIGMIDVIRQDVGRLRVSEVSSATVKEVLRGMSEKKLTQSSYEELPSAVRAFTRVVNWPNLLVAVSAGSGSGYRGFGDLSAQIWASLNIVSITGTMDPYYDGGLYNLRASDYGFRVDEGTSVEFGLLAESWDRGGPVAAFLYALLAIAVLGIVETAVRAVLRSSPALRTIMVSTIFTTGCWALNCYNLPLSLRQLAVNLFFCAAVFGGFNMFFSGTETPVVRVETMREARIHPNRPREGFRHRRRLR